MHHAEYVCVARCAAERSPPLTPPQEESSVRRQPLSRPPLCTSPTLPLRQFLFHVLKTY